MAKGMYGAINGATRKVKKQYAVINGVTRKIKKLYAVVNGVTRLVWSGGGKFIIVHSTSYYQPSFSEDNGTSWTSTYSDLFGSTPNKGTYGNGIFIIVVSSGYIYYSSDGSNWSKKSSARLDAVCYKNNKFVGVGGNGVSAYSFNGIDWTTGTLNSANTFFAIDYGNGYYFTLGGNYLIHYSVDGQTWTLKSNHANSALKFVDICFGQGKYVIISNGGYLYYCTDIASGAWSNVAIWQLTYNTLKFIKYINGYFLIGGVNGTLLYSSDCINWTKTSAITTETLVDVTYGDGKYMVVTSTGNILLSSNIANWTYVGTGLGKASLSIIYEADGGSEA